MTTLVFEIPLLGTSAYHRDNLSALDRIVSEYPTKLIIKLLGPGGLAPEPILAYHDLLGTLTDATEIIAVSHSNLIGVGLALVLGCTATASERPPIPLGIADDEELNLTFLTDDDVSNEEVN